MYKRIMRTLTSDEYRQYIRIQRHALEIVKQAKKNGLLPRLVENGKPCGIKCSDCDNVAIMYDHRDYFQPLNVDPVCSRCNSRRGLSDDAMTKILSKLHSPLRTRKDIGELLIRINVIIGDEHIAKAKAIGGGNVSLGVRNDMKG